MRAVTMSALLSAALAAGAGAATWWLSPLVSGHAEPWDGSGLYYLGALVFGGALAGLVTNRPLIPVTLGFATGQMAFGLLALPRGPLWVVGLFFIGFFSLIAGGSGVLAHHLKRMILDRERHTELEP